ncbi:hypothetical protein [Escherichia coli]|uniref:hypothetical protein n=1 Tax=Escherichia coli TaxID=562 RepID=UPI001BFC3AAD|nr:hypothetical protein [Escherichia coli]
MESYFDRMFCRTTCNEYKFTTGQAYTIHRLRNATTYPMVFVMSDNEGTMYQVFYCGDLDYALVKNITGQWLAQFSRYPKLNAHIQAMTAFSRLGESMMFTSLMAMKHIQ